MSAAASGSLLLPGVAAAQDDVQSEKFSATYEFVANHTPESQPVQTLVRLNDPSGFQQLEALGPFAEREHGVQISVRTTREPEPAAYLEPTPEQAAAVADVEAVTDVLFSPGANPFWRLGDYEDGVFPAPADSVGLLDFEEMVQGMHHLADQHPNRLRLESIGTTAGRYNVLTHEIESNRIWLAELTNDVDDAESFAEKEKLLVFNQDSDERQGPEAMFRFVEDLLAGNEPEVESLLDDLVLLFMIPNPDGWVSKLPQYYSGAEAGSESVAVENAYRTDLATGADPNRSYPAPGFMDPENYPAESWGSNLEDDDPGVDDDVPDYVSDAVPGELRVTEHFRTRDYRNLEYGVDLHGFGSSDTFIEGFPLNGDYDYADLQDVYRLQESIGEAMAASDLGELISSESLRSTFEQLNQQYAEQGEQAPPVPEQTYNYGTLFDVLGYSTSGDTISWMSASPENGGLGGIKTFATETVYSIGEFVPDLVEAWVVANATVVRTTAQHVVRDVSADIDTGGASTAYVVADDLVRSSRDLSFDAPGSEGRTSYETNSGSATLSPHGTAEFSVEVSDAVRLLVVTVPEADGVRIELVDPSEETVRSRRFAAHPTGFGSTVPRLTRTVESPGNWRVRVRNLRDGEQDVDVRVGRLQSEATHPNPEDVLGFTQRDYTVSPFAFFREHEVHLTNGGGFEAVEPQDVADGALTGDDGPAFENVVVVHDQGSDSDAYVSALDDYVAAGGNLVLTDTGVHLLASLDNGLTEPFTAEDVSDRSLFTAYLGDRNDDHPLLDGTTGSQLEVGKWVPLGYSLGGEAPMTLVDRQAFQEAGGSVAATTGADEEGPPGVSAGSLTAVEGQASVQVVGGLLPPATQDNLHPFGVSDYSLSHLGMSLLTNALGYETNVSTTGG